MGDGNESSSGDNTLTQPATAAFPIHSTSLHDSATSLSFSSISTFTAPPAAALPRPPIHHNGLHPLHPSSSSATFSLSLAPPQPDPPPEQYKTGQLVDVYDPLSNDWFQGQVTRLSAQGIHIHYTGWPDSADTIIPPSQSYQKKHLAPHRTHTTAWTDDNDHACSACGNGGDVLCCDRQGCVKVWHKECADLRTVPEKQWCCPDCRTGKKGRQRQGQHKKEVKREAGTVVSRPRHTATARKTNRPRKLSTQQQEKAASSLHRAPRRSQSKQWQDPLEAEADEDDWHDDSKQGSTGERNERRERQQRLGVKWSLRPLRQKKPVVKQEHDEVAFEDDDDDDVRRMEMKYSSERDDDEDYQQEDTPVEKELEDEDGIDGAEEEEEEEAVEEGWEPQEELLPDEEQPLFYRRYRRPPEPHDEGSEEKKMIGYGRENGGKQKKEEGRKRKSDEPERPGKGKKGRAERDRWELPVDDEETREELHEWMSSSHRRAGRSRSNDEWRYQQDDERLQEEGETAEERAEREHDTAVRSEQRKQRQQQEEERMRRERMWNSSAIYAVLQQLDTLTLLQLTTTTIERMGDDMRIQALTTAAPSLQALLSTVTATSIADAYSSAPATSPPSFPPPPPTFSSFLASLHTLVAASVAHHSAELHTYRFLILRSLDLQWRQYIRQHTLTINALWQHLEARERLERDIQAEMEAEERVCEEWRKQFSVHWEVAQRMHDRLEAEERELREWSEWCEARQKEAEEDDGEEDVVHENESKAEMSDAELGVRREARRDKSGMLVVALCLCLLMKWRAMESAKDLRKAFDALIVPITPPRSTSPPPCAAVVEHSSSPPSSAYVLDGEDNVNGDDGYVNLDHTIILSTSPPHAEVLGELNEADSDGPVHEDERAYYDVDPMEDNHANDGPVSPLPDDDNQAMEDGTEMSADDTQELTAAAEPEAGRAAVELDVASTVDLSSAAHPGRSNATTDAATAAASDAPTASRSSSPQPTTNTANKKAALFLPFLSHPVLTADGFESHALTHFPEAAAQLPLLPIAGPVFADTDKSSADAQSAAVRIEQSSANVSSSADHSTDEVCDAPAAAVPVVEVHGEPQPCRHTCGCAEPPDTLFTNHRPHERDRMLHPLCSERKMDCNALFKFTPVERSRLASASRRRGKRSTALAASRKCRHKCGCSLSRHKRFDQSGRRLHERDELLHMHCKSLGLECVALFEKESRAGECRHTCGSCTLPAGTVHEFMRKHEKEDALHPQCRAKGELCTSLLSGKPQPVLPAPPPPPPLPVSPPPMASSATDAEAEAATTSTAPLVEDEQTVLPDVASTSSQPPPSAIDVCSHTCGCVLPDGELISNIAQHERSAVWHPHCSERAEACTSKLVQRQREQCRHVCGCVDGAGATYLYRLSHEAKHSKHPQCAEKELHCAKLLSTIDDREARIARQAEQKQQQHVHEAELDEDDEDEDELEEDSAGDERELMVDEAASSTSGMKLCPHVCGSCRKHGRAMLRKSVWYHQRSELLHPGCRDAGLECSELLRTDPLSKTVQVAEVSLVGGGGRQDGATAASAEQQPASSSSSGRPCRHQCGCLSGEGRLFLRRGMHERHRSKHPHCAAKGLKCAKSLGAADERKQEGTEEAPRVEDQPNKTQRLLQAPQSARLEVSKRSLRCLHRTSRCNVQCQQRFTTAHEAVQHAATEHQECACGGSKAKRWMKRAQLRLAKLNNVRQRRLKRREEKEKKRKKQTKEHHKHAHNEGNNDELSDNSALHGAAVSGRTPPSSHSHSSASLPSSPYSGPSLFDPIAHPGGMVASLQPPAPPPLPSFSAALPNYSAVPLSAVSAAGVGLVSRLQSPPLSSASFGEFGGVSPFL